MICKDWSRKWRHPSLFLFDLIKVKNGRMKLQFYVALGKHCCGIRSWSGILCLLIKTDLVTKFIYWIYYIWTHVSSVDIIKKKMTKTDKKSKFLWTQSWTVRYYLFLVIRQHIRMLRTENLKELWLLALISLKICYHEWMGMNAICDLCLRNWCANEKIGDTVRQYWAIENNISRLVMELAKG